MMSPPALLPAAGRSPSIGLVDRLQPEQLIVFTGMRIGQVSNLTIPPARRCRVTNPTYQGEMDAVGQVSNLTIQQRTGHRLVGQVFNLTIPPGRRRRVTYPTYRS